MIIIFNTFSVEAGKGCRKSPKKDQFQSFALLLSHLQLAVLCLLLHLKKMGYCNEIKKLLFSFY